MKQASILFGAATLAAVVALPGAAAAQSLQSGGHWAWSNIGQAECMARAERVLRASAAAGGNVQTVASYRGWYVTMENDPTNSITVHCIADDDTENFVNDSPRVMIAIVIATTNMAWDMAAFRESVTACVVNGNCPP